MKKIVFFAFVISVILISCSSDDDKDNKGLTFSNDIDQMIGWVQHPSFIKGNAHSGNYMCKVDSTMAYSYTFILQAEDFPTKTAKSINASVWGKISNLNDSINLVIELTSKGQTIAWNGNLFINFIKNIDEWGKVESSIKIPENLPSDAILKVYARGTKKKSDFTILDDFEISFVE